jgi:hypothetical protein
MNEYRPAYAEAPEAPRDTQYITQTRLAPRYTTLTFRIAQTAAEKELFHTAGGVLCHTTQPIPGEDATPMVNERFGSEAIRVRT